MRKNIGLFNYLFFSDVDPSLRFFYKNNIFCFLKNLVYEYPFFKDWYNSLFDVEYNVFKEREIIICEYNKEIVGISILKNTDNERKICTLRVSKNFRHLGIGRELLKSSIDWLEDEKPLITVHRTRQKEFNSLFNYFNFKLEQKKWSYYSLFNTELVYNGELPGKNIILNKLEIVDLESFIKKQIAINGYFININEVIDKCIDYWYTRYKYNNYIIMKG